MNKGWDKKQVYFIFIHYLIINPSEYENGANFFIQPLLCLRSADIKK